MATTVAFALNTGSTIAGTIQIGDIAVGAAGTYDYSTNPGGVKWWMGPDEDLGYLIIAPDTGYTHESPTGTNAGIKFKRSTELTESSFLNLTNHFATSEHGYSGFTGNTEAKNWLDALGFPTSFNSNEPEITTYISGLTTPICAYQIGVLNKFVKDIKSGYNINAFSDVFDVMLILANETPESSLRNIVKRSIDATAVNSPVHTPYQGYKSVGASYINSNYRAAYEGTNHVLNNGSLGLYARTSIDNCYYTGAYGYSGLLTRDNIFTRVAPSYSQTSLQNDSNNNFPMENLNASGMIVASRTGSTQYSAYQNKIIYATIVVGSSIVNPKTYLILAYNNYSYPNVLNPVGMGGNQEMALWFTGRGLSQSEILILTDAFELYMDTHGKGVI